MRFLRSRHWWLALLVPAVAAALPPAKTGYDEQVRVPLVVKLPERAAAGTAVDARVSSINVMPTVLDLLDVAVPMKVWAQLRGRSLVPAMRGEPLEARDAFAETDYRAYTFSSGASSRRTGGS